MADTPQETGVVTFTKFRFSDLNLPMLYTTGENDVLVHPETIRIASELIPHSEFYVFRNAGHSSYYEQPKHFNEVVHRFLKKSFPDN